MLLIQEFVDKVSKDAYGGSAELVDDAILCFANELKEGNFTCAQDVAKRMEENVDAVLQVCSPILPLINLLNLCMQFVEELQENGYPMEEAVGKGCEFLENRRAEQASCLDRIGEIGEKWCRMEASFPLFLRADL